MRYPSHGVVCASAAAAFLILSTSAQLAPGQPAAGGAWKLLTGYHSEQRSAFEAISLLLRVAEVPSGFAAVRACTADAPVSLSFPAGLELHAALREVFALTGATYRQEERLGVINVLPGAGLPALLNVRIEKLTLHDPANLTLSISQIAEEPAFRQILLASEITMWERLSIMMSIPQPGDPEPLKPQPLEIRDMLVIEVLNLLVLRHGQAVWLYNETHCAGQRPRVELSFLRQ